MEAVKSTGNSVLLWWNFATGKWTTEKSGGVSPAYFIMPVGVSYQNGNSFKYSEQRTGCKMEFEGLTKNDLTGYGKGTGNLGAPVATSVTIPPQSIKLQGTMKFTYEKVAELQTEKNTCIPFITIEVQNMPFILLQPLRLGNRG